MPTASAPDYSRWHSMNHPDEPRDQQRDLDGPYFAQLGPTMQDEWSFTILQATDAGDAVEVHAGCARTEAAAKQLVDTWQPQHTPEPRPRPSVPLRSEDDYTTTPDRVRVYQDEYSAEWCIDGVDTRQPPLAIRQDGRPVYPYTEHVWSFPTFHAAHRAVPEFYARHVFPTPASH